MLECPVCQNFLDWRITDTRGHRIEEAEARCTGCDVIYPIHEGIGLFLTPDLERRDLWGEVESDLSRHLRENPDVERRLMEVPIESLAPADQFFRGQLAEERGFFDEASVSFDLAMKGLYTHQYQSCRDSQLKFVIAQASRLRGPIVDLASGRCELVEPLARRLNRPVVATDFSPNVLRRDRRWLEFLGLYDNVSLLAFDALRTPFRDGVVETLTTNLGLTNIENPGDLLTELRRIVRGRFLAISHFFPEGDEANGRLIRQLGLDSFLYRHSALQQFSQSGWEVELDNSCISWTEPTPLGVVLDGAQIDALPVEGTQLEWCVLSFRHIKNWFYAVLCG